MKKTSTSAAKKKSVSTVKKPALTKARGNTKRTQGIKRSAPPLNVAKIEQDVSSAPTQENDLSEPQPEKDARTQFEKLVKPKNYHEYMRASNFRGNR